jgi:hypothetical protein
MSQLRIGVAVLTMGTRPVELDALQRAGDVQPHRHVAVPAGELGEGFAVEDEGPAHAASAGVESPRWAEW